MNAETNFRSNRQDAASEYLPFEAEVEPQPEQKWERTKRILDARWKAEVDPRLGDFAVRLFTLVLDLALHPKLNLGPGRIGVSQYKLSQWLHKSQWTIRRANKELVEHGHVWFDDTHQPGRWDMLVYHIELIDPQKTATPHNRFELFGNGVSRQRPGIAGRDGKGRFSPPPEDHGAKMPGDSGQICPVTAGILAPSSGQICPVTPGKNARQSTPKAASPPGNSARRHRAVLLRTDGQSCSVQRANLPAGTGQECPILIESETIREVQSSEKTINRLGNRAGAAAGKSKEAEREFLWLCAEVFGDAEMEKNGGLWRTIYRQNPTKARAVVLETQTVLKEGRIPIKTTPAKYAMDLWKRFK